MLPNAPRQVVFLSLSRYKFFAFVIALLCFSLNTHSHSFSPTTPIPDSTFEQALIALNIDTNGLNGNILNSDALAVHTLFIGNIGVTNLSGIEAFGNLINLYAYNNSLSSVDLSNNTKLEILDLDNNNLSSLNIENNEALIKIYISNNAITTLDLSHNLQLEFISCNLNNLSALDVSLNTLLKDIRCYSNNLTSIDLSNNLNLEKLFISENSLTSLDLTMNTSLETLTCDNNDLNSIDLSNNTVLDYLGCSNNNLNTLTLTNNTALKRLLCNNNNLTSIDVSTAEDLFLFYTMNNQIQSIDLSDNSDLKYFRAENNLLTNVDIRNNHNHRINEFVVTQNSGLTCVFVDNPNASYLSDWELDGNANFVEDEDECQTLSVKEDLNLSFTLYPNPANDFVNVNLNTHKASFKLYTIKGQFIFEKDMLLGSNTVDISDLSAGLYVVAIQTENGLTTKKLVIN
ncbi:T9SS type A sorting domain-containing protein [Lacinutrix iliipiscaria]|uniref:T9SS type A sorting domain-containing protein n=1 Tax=Lacinutrix iliipiscaria TaxID=1230532 RepID=A0ABW5WQE9_9FLAO